MNADAIQIESDAVEVRHLTMVGTVPGVAPLLAAARNGSGIGTLLCSGDGALLSWRAPGSAEFGEEVDCSADGQYLLEDGVDADKWIRVDVHANYLVAGSQAEVFLAEVFGNAVGGPDVAAADAAAGYVLDTSIDLKNLDEFQVSNLKIWMDADPRLSISLDGGEFSSPTDEAGAITVAAIAAGDSVTLHIRRTILAGEPASPKNRVGLHFAFDAYPTV